MREICETIKSNVAEVLVEWEHLVKEQPWFSLPADHRINSLPDVLVGLVEASLCNPTDVESHRKQVNAAAEHGRHRRQQGIPEHLMFTEYHLLRQAIWHFLHRRFGASERVSRAILRIDSAITVATNASMWGFHRAEIEAVGKWDEGIERIIHSSPFLSKHPPR